MVQEWEQEAGFLMSPSLFPFPHRVRCTGSGCSSSTSSAQIHSDINFSELDTYGNSLVSQQLGAAHFSLQMLTSKTWLFLARPKTHLVQFLASDKSW